MDERQWKIWIVGKKRGMRQKENAKKQLPETWIEQVTFR